MGRLLSQLGHTVSFACDGKEFLALMHGAGPGALATVAGGAAGGTGKIAPSTVSMSFDAILMDRHMPNLEGPDAARYRYVDSVNRA